MQSKDQKNVSVVLVPVEPENSLLIGSEILSPASLGSNAASPQAKMENGAANSPKEASGVESNGEVMPVKKQPKKHFEMIRMKNLIMKKEKEAQE